MKVGVQEDTPSRIVLFSDIQRLTVFLCCGFISDCLRYGGDRVLSAPIFHSGGACFNVGTTSSPEARLGSEAIVGVLKKYANRIDIPGGNAKSRLHHIYRLEREQNFIVVKSTDTTDLEVTWTALQVELLTR